MCQLQGIGDLRPADQFVDAFFGDLDTKTGAWADLLDANVLVTFVLSASLAQKSSFTLEWVAKKNQELQSTIRRRLRGKGLPAAQKAGLWDVLGHLKSQIDGSKLEPREGKADHFDSLAQGVEGQRQLIPAPASAELVDADGAIQAWLKFARLAKKAPLAPVESVSTIVGLLAPVLVERDGYRELVDLLDGLQAQVGGDSSAAERSRDRALALLEQGRPLDALSDLHEAKVRWWHGDTIRGSLLALMFLSRCYEELGLSIAARQEALVAVGLASAHGDEDDLDIIATGLMAVAHLDYSSGSWFAAVDSYLVASWAHSSYHEDPFNVQTSEDSHAAFLHSGYLRAAAEVADPKLEAWVRERQSQAGLSDVLDEVEDDVPDWNPTEWREKFLAELGVVPFADGGADRLIQWSALGVTWEIRCPNRYEHCRAAERFAAAAQILCAELAREELVLLPTTIRARIQAVSTDRTQTRPRVRSQPGNKGSDWLVDLLPVRGTETPEEVNEIAQELGGALIEVLFEASLAPWKRHEEVLDRFFKRGLAHKLSSGRPYDDVAAVVGRKVFAAAPRETARIPSEWRSPPIQPAKASLEWRTTPGPGYSKRKAKAAIRNRYRRSREVLTETLPRLAHDEDFLNVYGELREAGWLDWHVLLALLNARFNCRQMNKRWTEEEMRAAVDAQLEPETDAEAPLPPEFLTVERLTQFRRVAFLSGVGINWDLELHQRTPDLQAVERLLLERYGYATDDVEHEPIFHTQKI